MPRSPARVSIGSPGTRRIRKKANRVIPKNVGMIRLKRVKIKRNMAASVLVEKLASALVTACAALPLRSQPALWGAPLVACGHKKRPVRPAFLGIAAVRSWLVEDSTKELSCKKLT